MGATRARAGGEPGAADGLTHGRLALAAGRARGVRRAGARWRTVTRHTAPSDQRLGTGRGSRDAVRRTPGRPGARLFDQSFGGPGPGRGVTIVDSRPLLLPWVRALSAQYGAQLFNSRSRRTAMARMPRIGERATYATRRSVHAPPLLSPASWLSPSLPSAVAAGAAARPIRRPPCARHRTPRRRPTRAPPWPPAWPSACAPRTRRGGRRTPAGRAG